ncbi:hypothetical protein SDC49_21350 [Lactobacillus sp. R2/2]|nr:hypothetical protein [Lactobacillus sp. R2/2]
MKLRKTLTWSVVVAALAAASGISVNQTNLVQAATSKKPKILSTKPNMALRETLIFLNLGRANGIVILMIN